MKSKTLKNVEKNEVGDLVQNYIDDDEKDLRSAKFAVKSTGKYDVTLTWVVVE